MSDANYIQWKKVEMECGHKTEMFVCEKCYKQLQADFNTCEKLLDETRHELVVSYDDNHKLQAENETLREQNFAMNKSGVKMWKALEEIANYWTVNDMISSREAMLAMTKIAQKALEDKK